MKEFSRMIAVAGLGVLVSIGIPAAANDTISAPVLEEHSTGLMTFSGQDKSLRVAIAFVKNDEAVIPIVIKFVDARGRILKRQRAELRDGQPFVAELTRADVAGRGELLVRAAILFQLPGARQNLYPVLASVQPIALDGSARLVWQLPPPGICDCEECGSDSGSGQHVDCDPEAD